MNESNLQDEPVKVKGVHLRRCKVKDCMGYASGLDLCVKHRRLVAIRPGYTIEMRRNGKLATEALPAGMGLRLAVKAFAAGVDEMKRRGTVYDWLALVETAADGHRDIITAVRR